MDFIHSCPLESHGDLSAYTILVDSRFTLKITDAGLWLLRDPATLVPPNPKDSLERDYEPLLWRAPELLRTKTNPKGSQKGGSILLNYKCRNELKNVSCLKYKLNKNQIMSTNK